MSAEKVWTLLAFFGLYQSGDLHQMQAQKRPPYHIFTHGLVSSLALPTLIHSKLNLAAATNMLSPY